MTTGTTGSTDVITSCLHHSWTITAEWRHATEQCIIACCVKIFAQCRGPLLGISFAFVTIDVSSCTFLETSLSTEASVRANLLLDSHTRTATAFDLFAYMCSIQTCRALDVIMCGEYALFCYRSLFVTAMMGGEQHCAICRVRRVYWFCRVRIVCRICEVCRICVVCRICNVCNIVGGISQSYACVAQW